MEYQIEDKRIDTRLEALLDAFEKEVEPYDKWCILSVVATPIGIIASMLLPMLTLQFIVQNKPSLSVIVSSPIIYYVFIGMLVTIVFTKISLLYVDYKKHEISRNKYKPLAGICMCDLSQLRFHYKKLQRAENIEERFRQAKLIKYYKHKIGWQ